MKTLKKIAIITLIAGIALVGVSFGMGLENYSIGTIYKHYKYEEKVLETEEDIKEIHINTKTQEVKVSRGDTDKTKITYQLPVGESEDLDMKIESSKINIKENKEWKNIISLGQSPDYKIEVELAKDTKLSLLDFSGNAGRIELIDIEADKSVLHLDLGDIIIANSKLNNGDLAVATGGITLKSTIIQNSRIKVNLGDIKGDVKPSGDVSFDVDTGSVKLESDIDDYSVELKTGLGEIKYNGQNIEGDYINTKENSENILRISTDLGDIRLETR